MGEVYRAMDTRLEREVALKLVSESFLGVDTAGSPSPKGATPHSRAHLSHERFLREARSAATLNHPNICAIHDTGEQDGRPYLVMELLRGETLKQYLAEAGRPLRPDEVISFSQQAAAALAAAHAKGIIHRDIKPANLFVNRMRTRPAADQDSRFRPGQEAGRGGLGDSRPYGHRGRDRDEAIGLRRLDLTSPGCAVGTVAYMSPEQAKGAPLDARTDLFSLGTVIYEMATGQAVRRREHRGGLRGSSSRRPAAGEHDESGHAEGAGCHRRQAAGQGQREPIPERRRTAAGPGGSGDGRGHGRARFARFQQSSGRRSERNDPGGDGGSAAAGAPSWPKMAACYGTGAAAECLRAAWHGGS